MFLMTMMKAQHPHAFVAWGKWLLTVLVNNVRVAKYVSGSRRIKLHEAFVV